jgi:hypothetical protein
MTLLAVAPQVKHSVGLTALSVVLMVVVVIVVLLTVEDELKWSEFKAPKALFTAPLELPLMVTKKTCQKNPLCL